MERCTKGLRPNFRTCKYEVEWNVHQHFHIISPFFFFCYLWPLKEGNKVSDEPKIHYDIPFGFFVTASDISRTCLDQLRYIQLKCHRRKSVTLNACISTIYGKFSQFILCSSKFDRFSGRADRSRIGAVSILISNFCEFLQFTDTSTNVGHLKTNYFSWNTYLT